MRADQDPNRLNRMAEQAGPDSGQEEPVAEKSKSVEELLDELVPRDGFEPLTSIEPRTAFQLLDDAPNGRKLMNYLFHSSRDKDRCGSELQRATSIIAHEWFEEERKATSQLKPAALQLDVPVIFSWSKKSGASRSTTASDRKTSAPCETTNQVLFKSVSSRLSEINKHRENARMAALQDERDLDPESSLRKQQWAGSEFHVDPLQPFVAKALPRESKRDNTAKKKVKRRSILNFWGLNGESRRKEKPKAVKEDTAEEPQDKGRPASKTLPKDDKPVEKKVQDPLADLFDQPASPSPPASSMSMSTFVPLQPKKK